MKKKHALTLLEIMIVIFLIGIIGSVIGYNMKGSLDEGRAFRTEQAIGQIRDILAMEIAQGNPVDVVVKNPESFLKHSGLVKDPAKLLKDGWGVPFTISAGQIKGEVRVSSKRYTEYKNAKRDKLKGIIQDDEEDQQEDEE